MKLAVYILGKETEKLKSYSIYDKEKQELEEKVKEFNETDKYNKAVIIDDALTVEALGLRESTKTIGKATDRLAEEFEDIRRDISNMLDNVGYGVDGIREKVKELITDKIAEQYAEQKCKEQRELMCLRVMKIENSGIVDILNILSGSPLATDEL